MLRHNLLILYRGFLRFKSTFLINTIGLSTALASAILIYLWVHNELSFDRYHEHTDRVFQVMENKQQDGKIETSRQTAEFLAATLAEEIPEVEYAVVVTPPNFFPSFTLSGAGNPVKGSAKFADKDFFRIFSYHLIQGNASQVLADKTAIVVSESLARKLYHTPENSIGKSLEWQMMDLKKQVMISGVFSDVPENSSETFDFVLPFDSFRDLMGWTPGAAANWDDGGPFFSYVRVREGTNADQLNEKMKSFLSLKRTTVQHRALFLKSFGDNYLYGQYENGAEQGGRIEYVILLSVIAGFVVLIACINFINLSTAQALRKIKDTGIKRVIGARKSTLVYQHLSEAFVITLISVVIAVIMVVLLLPNFNAIIGKNLELVFDANLIAAITVMVVVTTLLSGTYPAFYLSGFNPANVLKGKLSSSAGEMWLRKALVVFQFALSVIFIVSVMVVYKQIEFIQTKNLGYDKENVIYFDVEGKVAQNSGSFIAELKKIPGVVNVSGMLANLLMGEGGGLQGSIEWEGKKIPMNNSLVNYGLPELLGMTMKEGRTFSKDFSSDSDKVIFNEAAIDMLGIENPVGKVVDGKKILGVVNNFHYQSLHEIVKPYSFRLDPTATTTILIKFQPGKERQTIAALEAFYKSFNPGFVFNYKFLDKDYEAQYIGEQRVSVLSRYAAMLTIIISCLGLFGLVAFMTERRGKEIGIRKVLGSGRLDVVMLLSGDFTKMVLISIGIALPVSYYITTLWLAGFAYRIELEWWYFVSAAGMTLVISWLTIGAHTIRAAKTNPVTMLRSE